MKKHVRWGHVRKDIQNFVNIFNNTEGVYCAYKHEEKSHKSSDKVEEERNSNLVKEVQVLKSVVKELQENVKNLQTLVNTDGNNSILNVENEESLPGKCGYSAQLFETNNCLTKHMVGMHKPISQLDGNLASLSDDEEVELCEKDENDESNVNENLKVDSECHGNISSCLCRKWSMGNNPHKSLLHYERRTRSHSF